MCPLTQQLNTPKRPAVTNNDLDMGSAFQMEKTCKHCTQTKDVEDFYRKGRGHQSWCKQCTNDNAKMHYKNNKSGKIAYANRHKRVREQANRQHVCDYLRLHPCVDCGEKDILVLEFDHQGDKYKAISSMIHGYSLDRIKDEIAKCEIRCANCHRRRTLKANDSYRLHL